MKRKIKAFLTKISLALIVGLMISISPQKVSASEKDRLQNKVTLNDVIREIEKTSNYVFMYNSKEINLDSPANMNINSKDINETLSDLFKTKNIDYKIVNNQIILSPQKEQSISQNIQLTIKGIVSDVNNEPLIGVNVSIKENPSVGTITNFDGEYTIKVAKGQSLIFSYIGYAPQEVKVNNQTNVNVTLKEDTEVLDEVVVTALGIKKEAKALTYNVQKVSSEDITITKDANFINSLAGKIAGIQINSSASGLGGSSRVVMRGIKSFEGNNNALYVVDGIPLYDTRPEQVNNIFESPDAGEGDSFSNLNPEDIESISVLSGPAAAALYGSEGANGVLLVTTKKGEAGKLRVNFTNNTSFMSPFVMPQFQNEYGSKEGDFMSWGDKLDKSSGYEPQDFFQTGYNVTNSLSATFGTERARNYVSAASLKGRGIIPNNKIERLNLSYSGSFDLIKDKLTLDINTSYISEENRNMMSQGQYHNPLLPIYLFPRGDEIDKYKIYERYDEARGFKTQYWPEIYGNRGLAIENPWWTVNRKLFENEQQRYIGSTQLKYKITDWLNISGRLRGERVNQIYERKIYASSDPLFASPAGNYMNQKTGHRQIYADFLINFDKRLGDFSLSANLGASYREYKYDMTSYEGHLDKVPNKFTFSNIMTNHPETKAIQDGFKDQSNAVFFTGQVGWKSMVYADITARNDRPTSLAGMKKNIFYPSIGLSGIISEMVDLSKAHIDFFKVRASYAEVGNPPRRHITSALYALNSGKISTTTFRPVENLTPERSKAFEVGTNLKMFNNRVSLDLTYYNSNTTNQLVEIQTSSSSGYESYFMNTGKVNNWGIEAALGYRNQFGDFGWNTNLTFTMNRNKIKELIAKGAKDPEGNSLEHLNESGLTYSKTDSYQMRLTEGGTMGDIYVSTLDRDDNGYIKVDPSTGSISTNPNRFIKAGSVMPRFNFGWNNSFTYKGFSFGFLIDARIGGVGVSATQALMDRYGVSKQSADARNKGGVIVNGAQMDAESYYSVVAGGSEGVLSEYIYSMTNIRLREASLGYTLPGKWFNNYINNLSISLVGRNLFMFHNKAPFDPEITASTGTYYQGYDYFMQPSVRTLGFSVKVQL